jgi:hypothetical protein
MSSFIEVPNKMKLIKDSTKMFRLSQNYHDNGCTSVPAIYSQIMSHSVLKLADIPVGGNLRRIKKLILFYIMNYFVFSPPHISPGPLRQRRPQQGSSSAP